MPVSTKTRPKKKPAPKTRMEPLYIGAHISVARGLDKAVHEAADLGCGALQIFTKNQLSWKERPLDPDRIQRFNQARNQTGITKIGSHCSYLINPATPDPEKRRMSVTALENELVRSADLGLKWVVLHPGSHMGRGEDRGIKSAAALINQAMENAGQRACLTRLLLETTAGQGTCIGHRFSHFRDLISAIQYKERLGVCVDFSHIFAAGYDIRTPETYAATWADFHRTVGLDQIRLVHANDSAKDLGTKVDRHAHIGKGRIGIHAFEALMTDPRFSGIPKILETPKTLNGHPADPMNLDLLRKAAGTPAKK